jgi:hypothetical protein
MVFKPHDPIIATNLRKAIGEAMAKKEFDIKICFASIYDKHWQTTNWHQVVEVEKCK